MFKDNSQRISDALFALALVLIVYMPLHVFIVQSVSLLSGGIEVWKAAKDVLVVVLVPFMLYVSYKGKLFRNKTFRWLMIIGGIYTLLHGWYVVFDADDDTYSAIVASVYNTRLLGYLLLGYLVGTAKNGERYLRYLLTAALLIGTAVAAFGVLQYFLPADLLTHVGYSLERGVKPMFFIDDKPDLPRVMSTLKDPNSLGAYLIAPILLTAYVSVSASVNKKLFIREFRRGTLLFLLGLQVAALLLSFSRGAFIGLLLGIVTLLYIVRGQSVRSGIKKYWYVFPVAVLIISSTYTFVKDSYVVQNVIFHADESTVLEDPNELRVRFLQETTKEVLNDPLGDGPGSAGLVSITNPKGGTLTENYYLQVAYEVGWVGIGAFMAILSILAYRLLRTSRSIPAAAVLVASLAAYLFYSLLIHLWSNEAVALQWWLLTGSTIGLVSSGPRKTEQ